VKDQEKQKNALTVAAKRRDVLPTFKYVLLLKTKKPLDAIALGVD
jgi:hypothetical protein